MKAILIFTLTSGNINLEVHRAQRSISGAYYYKLGSPGCPLKAFAKVGDLAALVGAWWVESEAAHRQHSYKGEAASGSTLP